MPAAGTTPGSITKKWVRMVLVMCDLEGRHRASSSCGVTPRVSEQRLARVEFRCPGRQAGRSVQTRRAPGGPTEYFLHLLTGDTEPVSCSDRNVTGRKGAVTEGRLFARTGGGMWGGGVHPTIPSLRNPNIPPGEPVNCPQLGAHLRGKGRRPGSHSRTSQTAGAVRAAQPLGGHDEPALYSERLAEAATGPRALPRASTCPSWSLHAPHPMCGV